MVRPDRRRDVPEDAGIRVLLADDHAVVREGLKAVVNAESDMYVVGEAANGIEACEAARALNPSIVIMDVSMPLMGGVEATERVRRECPEVKVLALTVHAERSYVSQLLRAGASGYVLKRAAAADLVRAVRVVASGQTYIDPGVTSTVVEGFLGARDVDDTADTLSERERDVLTRIARGFSNKEIAAALTLSVKTVETYKARVAEKLGLRSRAEMVRYAAARGWLREEESSGP